MVGRSPQDLPESDREILDDCLHAFEEVRDLFDSKLPEPAMRTKEKDAYEACEHAILELNRLKRGKGALNLSSKAGENLGTVQDRLVRIFKTKGVLTSREKWIQASDEVRIVLAQFVKITKQDLCVQSLSELFLGWIKRAYTILKPRWKAIGRRIELVCFLHGLGSVLTRFPLFACCI